MNNHHTQEQTALATTSDDQLSVSIGELSEAITLEVRSLEFRRSVIQRQKKRSSIRPRDYQGGGKGNAAWANSSADPVAEQARHNLKKAETQLENVSKEIETHNASLNSQSMIVSLIFFISNYLRGSELDQRRARVLRRYQHAKSDWQAISVTMQRQASSSTPAKPRPAKTGTTQISLLEERKLSILLSFLVSEIATRKHLQSLLVGIPSHLLVAVSSRDLDRAIRDPVLQQRLLSLRERRQRSLR